MTDSTTDDAADEVATTTDTDATKTADPDTSQLSETDTLKAEIDKWKSLSRKNEQQAKINSSAVKELDDIKKSQLSDTDKLVEQVREETALEIRKEYAAKLVDSDLKGMLNGRYLDGNSFLDFDRASFILSDGNIDSEAIQSWVDAHSTKAEPTISNLGQGARGKNLGKSQIQSRDDLKNMSPEEVLAATKEGRLDGLMGKTNEKR